jgi:hypothetical protein
VDPYIHSPIRLHGVVLNQFTFFILQNWEMSGTIAAYLHGEVRKRLGHDGRRPEFSEYEAGVPTSTPQYFV